MGTQQNTKNYLTDLGSVVELPHAHWVGRLLILRAVRRSMTIGQYIAYCRNHAPIR